MTVQHKNSGDNGSFFVEADGDVVAEMVYKMRSPGQMVIEHTEVNELMQGKNIGYELVQAGVEYARSHHIKITPLCSFAKSVIDKKTEWHDVLER